MKAKMQSIIMKRVLTVCLVACFGMQLQAQIYDTTQHFDTLWIGDREPTFYYWDTNWFDYYYNQTRGMDNIRFSESISGDTYGQSEWARFCYTDSALRVIGVAAAIYIAVYNGYSVFDHGDPYASFVTDYLRLYEVDSTTNEMVLLASKPWTGTQPRYMLNTHYEEVRAPFPTTIKYAEPVFEVYFDSAITVHDSFYVSMTMFNNVWTESAFDVDVHLVTFSEVEYHIDETGHRVGTHPHPPYPGYIRRKQHRYDEHNFSYNWPDITDTNWHVISKAYAGHDTASHTDWFKYLSIFPIIDTMHEVAPRPIVCPRPTNLSKVYIGQEVAVFSWTADGADRWQLSIADPGQAPDEGLLIDCTSDIKSVTGLDTGRCYVARVRSICADTVASDWSDSVQFCTKAGEVGIGTVADSYTRLFPNPAHNSVTVTSAFRISRMELYTEAGTRVRDEEADGMSLSLDLGGIPAGNYLIRIRTNHGNVVKKLVVK